VSLLDELLEASDGWRFAALSGHERKPDFHPGFPYL
jgi:hypothetical protein